MPRAGNESGINQDNLINIGFGSFVPADRIIAIINPASSPMRRLRDEAREERRLIDATQGRKTRAIILTDSNHIILSAVLTDTIGQRFTQES